MDLRFSLLKMIVSGEPDQRFYNCSSKSPQEWFDTGLPQPYLGTYFMMSGTVLEIIYILCLVVMFHKDLMKSSCYKIMFALGLTDIISILVNSILTGYLTYVGAVFCTHPHLIFSIGSIGLGCWCLDCFYCVLLALNRCYELCNIKQLNCIFQRNRVIVCLVVAVFYCVFMTFFTTPPVFNSNLVSWFFNPMNGQNPASVYFNDFHSINNILMAFITTILYIFLCVQLFVLGRGVTGVMNRLQRQVFIQSFLICVFNVMAAYVYVYMQYCSISPWFILTGQLAWQYSSGSPGLIYLAFNGSIRRGVLRMIVPTPLARRLNLLQPSNESRTIRRTPTVGAIA